MKMGKKLLLTNMHMSQNHNKFLHEVYRSTCEQKQRIISLHYFFLCNAAFNLRLIFVQIVYVIEFGICSHNIIQVCILYYSCTMLLSISTSNQVMGSFFYSFLSKMQHKSERNKYDFLFSYILTKLIAAVHVQCM